MSHPLFLALFAAEEGRNAFHNDDCCVIMTCEEWKEASRRPDSLVALAAAVVAKTAATMATRLCSVFVFVLEPGQCARARVALRMDPSRPSAAAAAALLLVVAVGSGHAAGELRESLEKSGVIPDVIGEAPERLAEVAFPGNGGVVRLGNTLSPAKTARAPNVDFNGKPASW
ncbi:uncharacterized protein LOC144144705 [Haemaphysalis longicornis]